MKIKRRELIYLASLTYNDHKERLEELRESLGIDSSIEVYSLEQIISLSEQYINVNEDDTEEISELIGFIEDIEALYNRFPKY